MIESEFLIHLESEALVELVLRVPTVNGVQVVAADIGRLDKTQLRSKSGTDIRKVIEQIERVARARNLN